MSGRKGTFYTIDFAGDPKRLDRLAPAGFDLMTLANNHILNAGPQGLTRTMHQCDLVAGRRVDFQLIPILEFQGEPVPLLETCRDPALQEARSRQLDILYTSRLAGS